MTNKFGDKNGFIKSYLSGILRATLTAILVLFQFGLVFVMAFFLSNTGVYVYYAIEVISVIVIIGLVNNTTISSFKIGWLVVISTLPVAGFLMYLLWGRDTSTRKIKKENLMHIEYGYKFAVPDEAVMNQFEEDYGEYKRLAAYMEKEHFPLYKNNSVNYYPMGDLVFEAIIDDMKKAKDFIFIDFFIVAEGVLWERIKKVLIECRSRGVEIKFLYDDFGSMFRTDKLFWKELTDIGIEVSEFNPILKYLAKLYLNFRTHQKIIVIDGEVGYTGGMNIADEYTNEVERFGVWKDNAVRIEGEAVFGFTTTFLQMWGISTHSDVADYFRYKSKRSFEVNNCYCQIISDGPSNNPNNPIAAVYRQLIYSAKKYLYLTTPYLVPEQDILSALTEAREGGVDVRIITPYIPDKRMVNLVTKYNYGRLLKAGVRIYEYTPGFMHAKTIITDSCGIVGTINLDYRSMYIHYECGAFMWDRKVIEEIKEDLLKTIAESEEISYEMWKNRPVIQKLKQRVVYLFSSLM